MLLDNVTYNTTTFEVDSNFKESYSTNPPSGFLPKLLDTDMVEMADGLFKTALELQIGDSVKTIQISGSSIDNYLAKEFGLSYDSLVSETVYTTNIVTNKQKVNVLTFLNTLTFEDNSTWEDTMGSAYLIDREGVIKFERLFNVIAGDVVLLLNTTDNNVNFTRKTVVTNIQSKRVFSGWFISVETAMLFLTKTAGSTNNESFVSIEHNFQSCPNATCPNHCYYTCPSCPKNMTCSYGYCFPLC
jgi:hypothetical protein